MEESIPNEKRFQRVQVARCVPHRIECFNALANTESVRCEDAPRYLFEKHIGSNLFADGIRGLLIYPNRNPHRTERSDKDQSQSIWIRYSQTFLELVLADNSVRAPFRPSFSLSLDNFETASGAFPSRFKTISGVWHSRAQLAFHYERSLWDDCRNNIVLHALLYVFRQ